MKSEYHVLYNQDNLIDHEWWGYVHYNDYVKARIRHYHRVDGPAYISYNPFGEVDYIEYWLLDYEVSKEEFETPGFIDAFILEHS